MKLPGQLERSVLFGSLDEKARRDIAFAKPRSFSTGEPIFRLGDLGDSMMAVVVGTVRISLPTTRGKEVILADLRAGELFGEIAVLDGKPRSRGCDGANELRADGLGTARSVALPGA